MPNLRDALATNTLPEPAGVWIRVSSGGQNEKNQIPDVERWCHDRRYRITRRYTVHGKSAYKAEQDPFWQKVVKDAADGIIRVIVIWNVDRLDRGNILHAVPMVNAALATGVRIEFSNQPYIDLTTMPGRMAFANLCEMAHEESKVKSDRVRIAFDSIRTNEAWIGRAAYGYMVIGDDVADKYRKRCVPHPEHAPVVVEIFKRAHDGETAYNIAEDFNTRGIPSPPWKGEPGTHWYPRTIYSILRNPVYAGRRVGADGRTINRVSPLVKFKTWRAVQARLDARNAKREGWAKSKETALFTTVLRCDKCRRPMYIVRSNCKTVRDDAGEIVSRRYSSESYYCRNGCKTHVDARRLETEFRRYLADHLAHRVFTQEMRIPGRDWQDEIDHVALDIRELDPVAMAPDEYAARHAYLMEQLADYRSRKIEPDEIITAHIRGSEIMAGWDAQDTAGRRGVLLDLGLRLYVRKDTDGQIVLSGEIETDDGAQLVA